MKKYLVLDIHNLMYRNFFSFQREELNITIGLTIHSAINSINYLYNKFNPSDIICCFDSQSWRKIYTSLPEAITYKKYKGNRRQNMTPSQKEKLELLDTSISDFYDFLKSHSSLIVYKKTGLESDDLIAGIIDNIVADDITLISSDNDFLQLLDNPILKIYDPIKNKFLDLEKWEHDVNFFRFEKMFRGDDSDNVISAYPRLTKKKIRQAMTDKILLNDIMNHQFDVHYYDDNNTLVTKQLNTKDVFEENEMLMDLRKQPEYIREMINNTIKNYERGTFNLIDFLKFCQRYELIKIIETSGNYTKMLSKNGGDLIFLRP